MNILDSHKEQLFQLCESHKVKDLYLFGSALTDKFNETSDIDLLIDFYQVELLDYFDNYMDFKEKLESLLNRQIDLVEYRAVKNPIFKQILERDKHLIYERKSA